jgi:hypothetical protein
MQRICGKCRNVLGEKCGKCGSNDLIGLKITDAVDQFLCPCGNTWKTGDEPETTGLCITCLAAALETMRAA